MRRLAIALLTFLPLAACRHETREAGSSSTDTAATMMSSTAPSMTGTAVMPMMNQQIKVELTEYEIRMPDTLRAGDNVFTIVNAGKENHSFVIEGGGLHMALPGPLPRGDSATLEAGLNPGTYTVSCPVDGHKGKGMSKTVTVQK